VFSCAYGQADRENGIPNTLSTRFNNGSMTKMFTGVSIGRLIQDGRVDPAMPVGTYLPDYPNGDVATKVTIHHLLTHTGGTGDIFVPAYNERREQVRTVDDHIAVLGGRGPRFEPGTRFEYSNFGFVVLGAVIERVSGQNYHDYVDEHIFTPTGMTRTGALPVEANVPGLAVGYTTDDDGNDHPNTDTLPYCGSPAGCGYTTVEDLTRFAAALTGHQLLDARHTDLVTMAKGTVGWDGRFAAYGFFQNPTCGGLPTFGHMGGGQGMSGDLGIWPHSRRVLAILTNQDWPIAADISAFICCHLPHRTD
jgi:CubicO group peptidase (beta-lactamase class C family)